MGLRGGYCLLIVLFSVFLLFVFVCLKQIYCAVVSVYSGTCIMRPGKSNEKHINFIICLARSLQNHVYSPCRERPPVLRVLTCIVLEAIKYLYSYSYSLHEGTQQVVINDWKETKPEENKRGPCPKLLWVYRFVLHRFPSCKHLDVTSQMCHVVFESELRDPQFMSLWCVILMTDRNQEWWSKLTKTDTVIMSHLSDRTRGVSSSNCRMQTPSPGIGSGDCTDLLWWNHINN